jgi:hypothetical protein
MPGKYEDICRYYEPLYPTVILWPNGTRTTEGRGGERKETFRLVGPVQVPEIQTALRPAGGLEVVFNQQIASLTFRSLSTLNHLGRDVFEPVERFFMAPSKSIHCVGKNSEGLTCCSSSEYVLCVLVFAPRTRAGMECQCLSVEMLLTPQ